MDSVLTDALLSIDYRHAPDSTVDDDSGGGLFGVNPELFFRAEADRVYRICSATAAPTSLTFSRATRDPVKTVGLGVVGQSEITSRASR